MEVKLSRWQQWLHQPQRLRLHRALFQIHFCVGAVAGAYLALMSLTGSIIVYRDQLSQWTSVEWIVKLHTNLLLASTGRFVNGIGGLCLTLLCLTGAMIWWPGIKHWRGSLTVGSKENYRGFNWALHSALGFWSFAFIVMWGISGLYLSIPESFNAVVDYWEPVGESAKSTRFGDQVLFWLSRWHFGRFAGLPVEMIWTVFGLMPAALFVTGALLWWKRVLRPRMRGRMIDEAAPQPSDGSIRV